MMLSNAERTKLTRKRRGSRRNIFFLSLRDRRREISKSLIFRNRRGQIKREKKIIKRFVRRGKSFRD